MVQEGEVVAVLEHGASFHPLEIYLSTLKVFFHSVRRLVEVPRGAG